SHKFRTSIEQVSNKSNLEITSIEQVPHRFQTSPVWNGIELEQSLNRTRLEYDRARTEPEQGLFGI
ncbi:hypothetical protein QMN07_19830, partial [Leptospira santarosai]|uniref:hypothetical protein n=1 Tax=Leptospira santarosai TaxID=28183 RepID=UPI0024AEB479